MIRFDFYIKTIGLTIAYMLIISMLDAQSMQWANTRIGDNTITTTDLRTDNWGNIYQTGYFFNSVDFDPNAGLDIIDAGSINGNPNTYSSYISKVDAAGNHVWAKAFLPYSYDAIANGTSLDVDGNGNVFVAGHFQETVDFNPGPGIDTLYAAYTPFGQKSYFTKLDSNGIFNWVKTLSGNYAITAIKIDAANNILIEGVYSGTVDFDPGAGVTLLTTAYSSSLFLLKLDNNGDFLWVKQWENSTQYSTISSHILDIDQSNHIYISGNFVNANPLDIDPGAATYNVTGKGFIVKMNAAGDFIWGGSNTANNTLIHLDHTGNLITSGSYKGGDDTDPGPGTFYANGDGTNNIYITKSDPGGNLLWSKTLIRPIANETAYTIASDSNGHIFMGGILYHNFGNHILDCDPDTSTYILNTDGFNLLMYSMDSAGNFLWAKKSTLDYTCGLENMLMVTNPTNDLIVAGNYCQEMDIDFSPATLNIGVSGKKSTYLMKYNYCGSLNDVYHVGCNNVVLPDTTYLMPVNYIKEYLSATNCDSNVNIHVSLLNLITNQVINSCDSFTYYGQTYTQSGNYTQIVPNGIGCDSVHTLQININTPANQPSFLNLIQTIQPITDPGAFVWSSNIEVDSLYNMYVSGAFNHFCDFNPLGSPYIDSSFYPMYNMPDGLVARYDSSGMLTWMHKLQTMDPNGNEAALSICLNDTLDLHSVVSPYEGVYTFNFSNTYFGTTNIGGFFMPGYFGYVRIQKVLNDAISNQIIKIGSIDSAVNTTKQLYVKRGNNVAVFPSGGNFIGYKGAVDLQGNIYVTCNMQTIQGGSTYCTIAKLDSNLTMLWNKQIGKGDEFGFTPKGIRINSIKVDANGQLLLCGRFADSIDIDISPNTHLLTSNGAMDAFVAKFDTAANLLWAHAFGGEDDDAATTITTDWNGKIYLGGTFSSTSIDLDPSIGVSFYMKACGNADWKGGFISKYKPDGTFLKAMGSGSTITELQCKGPKRMYATGQPFVQVFEIESDTVIQNTLSICAGDSVTVGNAIYNQTGIYSDTFLVAPGIDSIVITNLTVNVLPAVMANVSDSLLCLGDSVILFGSGALTYTWNNAVIDSMMFSPNMTNNYVVTGTDIYGCVNTDSITVVVNALPAVTANASDTLICYGDSMLLFGAGALTYTWNNLAIDSVLFAPLATGYFVVNGTDTNGCMNQDSIEVVVQTLPLLMANASDTSLCMGDSVILFGSGAMTYTWNNAVIDSMIFGPNITSNYVVTGTDTNGCVNTDSITVVVNALPIVVANASDTSVCVGNPVTLFGTGADSFSWTNAVIDSVAFYPIDTAKYIVTGIDINGCIGQDSILINANQIPFPILVFSGDTLYCTNVSGVNIYWYKDTVAIDSLTNYYVVTQNGNYEVFVVDSNGCAGADSMSMLNVSYLTPIKSDIIQVYPNPTQGLIHIEFEMKQAGEVDLMIYDLMGNQVFVTKNKIPTTGKQQLNIDLAQVHLTTGIYFLNIFIDGKRNVVKFEYQR
jgi:hypothetical protein